MRSQSTAWVSQDILKQARCERRDLESCPTQEATDSRMEPKASLGGKALVLSVYGYKRVFAFWVK